MAKSIIPLKIFGLNQKQDPKVASPGVLSIAENVQSIRRTGDGSIEIRKRFGFSPLVKTVDGLSDIAACTTGSVYNGELILCDGLKLYSYSTVLAKWIAKGLVQSIAVDLSIIDGNASIQNSNGQAGSVESPMNTDVAYNAGLECFVSSGHDQQFPAPGRVYVRDATTGDIVGTHQLPIDLFRARVVAVGVYFLIFSWLQPVGAGASKIQVSRIAVATPGTISAAADVATNIGNGTDGDTVGLFDVAADPVGLAWVAYGNNAGTLTIKSWVAATNVAGVSSTYVTDFIPIAIGFLVHDFLNGSGYVGVVTQGTSAEAHIITFATASGAETADLNFDSYVINPPSFFPHITGYRTSGGVLNAFWTIEDGSDVTGVIEVIRGYSGGTNYDVIRSVALASRPFKIGTKWYLQVARGSTVVTVIAGDTADPDAKWRFEATRGLRNRTLLIELTENATGLPGQISPAGLILGQDSSGAPFSPCCLPSVPVLNSTRAISSAVSTLNLAPDVATASTEHRAQVRLDLSWAGSDLGRPIAYNGVLSIPCAAHKYYDGKDVAEEAFYTDPEAPIDYLIDGAAADGLTPSAAYQYCTTWARPDSRGRIHRSAPSPISSVVMPDVGTEPNPAVNGYLYSYRVTDTDPQYTINPLVSGAKIEVWRTQGDLDVFYLAAVINNAVTYDTIAFRDELSDIDIANNELLYTQSNELDNQKPPAVKSLRAYGDRLWALTGDRSTWHSKLSAEGFGAEFSDEFRLLVEDTGGAPTGLGSVDGTMVIFKRKRAYVVQGQGPDDKGTGPFGPVQPLQVDLGIVGPNSAVDVPTGILCETAEGRFLMNRSLTFEPVEGTESYAVTCAGGAGLDSRSMTAMVTSGVILARDWQLNQWFAWGSGLNGVAITLWLGQLVIFQADGTVRREVANQYFDGTSTAINEKVQFTYVELSNARIHKLHLIGEIMGSTTLTETVTYDDNPGTAASKTRACTTADKEPLVIIPNTGRMSALSVTVEETSITEGFRLSQVDLEVTAKSGLKKSPFSRYFT